MRPYAQTFLPFQDFLPFFLPYLVAIFFRRLLVLLSIFLVKDRFAPLAPYIIGLRLSGVSNVFFHLVAIRRIAAQLCLHSTRATIRTRPENT